MKNIEDNLFYLRLFNKREKPFSQKDISEISGIPQTHISRVEKHKELPRLIDIIFYSKFFGVSADDIIFKIYNPETRQF